MYPQDKETEANTFFSLAMKDLHGNGAMLKKKTSKIHRLLFLKVCNLKKIILSKTE